MIVIAVILILLSVILFMPLTFYVAYKDKKADINIKYGFINVNVCNFIKKKNINNKKEASVAKKENNSVKEKEKKQTDNNRAEEKNFNYYVNIISAFYEASGAIRKAVKVEKLNVDAIYGSNDAAFTGIVIGLAYAEIYKLLSLISCVFTVNTPVITITPDFSEKDVFEIEGEGIVKTNAVHIIFVGIKFYTKFKSYK